MIKQIQEINFPNYATLSQATITLNDMGDKTISTQVKIDGSIIPDFSYDWEVEFKGERYIHPLRQPQAGKSNDSISSKIDLVFQHKTIYELKRYYFVEMTSTESGTAIADQYIASLGLNLSDFCVAFQRVLDHYFNGDITIELNPNLEYTKGVQFMSISYSYIWDVLQKVYEVYGVRWTIEGNTIKVGYPSTIVSHTFQYGYEGGLLQVERQVQDANIRNSLLGRGGEQNLPAYYFKEAPEGSLFASDPDAIPELANVYFSNLRGKTFRDYVKGWKAKHYGGAPMSEPTEAYTKGYTDIKFNPIEYVEDKESIKKYGLLQGGLDNNEEIYPSIQGAPNGEDVVVYVEPVTTDEVAESVRKESVITNIEPSYITISMPQNSTSGRHKLSVDFEVPEGKVGYLSYNIVLLDAINKGNDITDNIIFLRKEFTVQNLDTLEKVDSTYYETGKYRYTIDFTLKSESNYSGTIKATVGIEQGYIEVFDSADNSDKWLPTFNIWVKNIWNSTRNVGENDLEYAERVWRPILGDRQGNEAKVVFSSGWLSGHEDYEFTIVDFAYDNSHENSEWRLTLAKSDAELEATGKYIPSASTNGQAYAGDTFFFIGIDMPHQYVLWAEERVDNWKKGELDKTSEIQPKWVVRLDNLRLNEENDNLVEQIKEGNAINLADVRFIDAPALQLYLQSVTYTWNEQTLLYPDVEVVLADTIVPVQNPVAQIQGSIDTINSQLANIGNVAQVVRKIGDSLYLRKDGVADTSKSPTKFVGEVSGNNFRQGKVGGADWAIYRDENGNAIAEFDKIIARKDLDVNNLVINQVSYVGGMRITSAASIEITRVIENDNAYQCFFDQKGGSVSNLFVVNDIAYSQRFDEENNTTKYYKRVVTEVGLDYITLSKSQADGEGVPMANDVVIHYGNTTDTNRQYVIIRDVIGGGYERMLSDLNSASATGVEYYFAGRIEGNTPRWFVGNNNQFIEYKDGHLQIKADVTLGDNSSLPERLDAEYLKKAFPQGNILDVNDGVSLASLIGVNDESGNLVAGLYGGGSADLNKEGYEDDDYGAMLLFGGIEGADKPTTYKTAIFENGHIISKRFQTGKEGKRVEIFDNELLVYGDDEDKSVLSISYDSNGKPRLQYSDKNGNVSWYLTDSGLDNTYSIEETDNNFISKVIPQNIDVVHNFLQGFTIAGIPFRKTANGQLFIDANVVFSGGVTMYGTDTTPAPSIFDGLPIDGETIYWDGDVLKAMGGGGVADSVAWANVTGKPKWLQDAGNAKPTYNYSEILNTPDLSVYALASSLANYALKTSIPTNNNQLTNGAGYITASALNGYATQSWVNTALAGYLPLSGGVIAGRLQVGADDNSRFNFISTVRLNHAAVISNTDEGAYFSFSSYSDGVLSTKKMIELGINDFRCSNDGGKTFNKIIHSGNYSDYALPIRGGNVSGDISISGNVGIGTDSPTDKLHVVGKALITDNLAVQSFKTANIAIECDRNGGNHTMNRSQIERYGGTLYLQYHGDNVSLAAGGGNVAIGGTTTAARLHVYGDTIIDKLHITTNEINGVNGTGDAHINYSSTGKVTIANGGGNVAIGGTTASAKLHVYGDLLTTGGITMYSQRSLKNILSYDGLSLEQLSVIKPIKFTWKDGRDNRYHVGGVADDMATVVPEVVYSANDFLTMDYGNAGFYVAASLIKPVINHEQRIQQLEQENKALRKEINQLKQAS